MEEIRNPKQKRAILKKDKIIEAGFKLITENGYHNTNTKEIAKEAGVSTGIIYQYFNDKHDIFMEGIKKYGDEIFFPITKISQNMFNKNDFEKTIETIIDNYINNHKLSKTAHEEITSMTHSDKEIASYFYEREINITKTLASYLEKNNFDKNNLEEKVHVMVGLIDNLCHEIIYHKHSEINYDKMKKIVIDSCSSIFKNDLEN